MNLLLRRQAPYPLGHSGLPDAENNFIRTQKMKYPSWIFTKEKIHDVLDLYQGLASVSNPGIYSIQARRAVHVVHQGLEKNIRSTEFCVVFFDLSFCQK